MVYPAYSGPTNVVCAKCGAATNAGTRYLPPGQVAEVRGVRITGEALVRSCKNCGYVWAEAPLGG